MILLPTFRFKGTVFPMIDNSDKLYLFIENDNDHRVLLNVVSSDVNRFINIQPKQFKIVYAGLFNQNLQTKMFYLGQELFDFGCREVNREIILFYSNYIFKKISVSEKIEFSTEFIKNGFRLDIISDTPHQLFIQVVDTDKNEILYEDSFISGDFYRCNKIESKNYNISIYNSNGDVIYNTTKN